jgi:hypothetical protein
MSSVSVGGAQLEEAPVSEMPDGSVPFKTCARVVSASWLSRSGDQ